MSRPILITRGDESKTLRAWCAEFRIGFATVTSRLQYGWDLERALTTPPSAPRERGTMITRNGESKSLPQWCAALGISLGTVRARLSSGWDLERALTTPVAK